MQQLTKSLDMLARNLLATSGEEVLYFQGDTEHSVRAVIGRNAAKTENEASLHVDARLFDFLIPVATFKVSPQVGDRIEVGKEVFEVLDIYGTGCWELSTCRKFKRIHTKRTNYETID